MLSLAQNIPEILRSTNIADTVEKTASKGVKIPFWKRFSEVPELHIKTRSSWFDVLMHSQKSYEVFFSLWICCHVVNWTNDVSKTESRTFLYSTSLLVCRLWKDVLLLNPAQKVFPISWKPFGQKQDDRWTICYRRNISTERRYLPLLRCALPPILLLLSAYVSAYGWKFLEKNSSPSLLSNKRKKKLKNIKSKSQEKAEKSLDSALHIGSTGNKNQFP